MISPSELACTLDVDIEYDATPPKVLQQLNDLEGRVAKYRADEPGDYLQVGPTITWSTSEHRSRWKATTSLYRQPLPASGGCQSPESPANEPTTTPPTTPQVTPVTIEPEPKPPAIPATDQAPMKHGPTKS